MLTTNYNLGPVGLGRSFVPSPGETIKSVAFSLLSSALSSVEHEVAVKDRIAIRLSVRIDLFMIVNLVI